MTMQINVMHHFQHTIYQMLCQSYCPFEVKRLNEDDDDLLAINHDLSAFCCHAFTNVIHIYFLFIANSVDCPFDTRLIEQTEMNEKQRIQNKQTSK